MLYREDCSLRNGVSNYAYASGYARMTANATSSYESLFICFRTGQMSAAQLNAHFEADEVFKAWFSKRMKQPLVRKTAAR